MSKNKYCIRDRFKCGPIFCEITDRWLDDKGEWHYRISCDTWLSESEIEQMVFDDAVERKTGKWAKQQKDFDLCGVEYFACSQCGFECQLTYNFCPYCGAKMEADDA